MQLRIFTGTLEQARTNFNEWAKGKSLTRDIIIHEQMIKSVMPGDLSSVAIFVYYAEGSGWDTPKSQPIPPVQSEADRGAGVACHEIRTLTAPIHNLPYPHIKAKEIKVTAQ